MLGEYYKYHNDIPRMFMLPAIIPLNWFHDRKRRLEYFRIAKMIDEENNKNPDKPPKGIVGDKPEDARESENVSAPQSDSSEEEEIAVSKVCYFKFLILKNRLQRIRFLMKLVGSIGVSNKKRIRR